MCSDNVDNQPEIVQVCVCFFFHSKNYNEHEQHGKFYFQENGYQQPTWISRYFNYEIK